jgi:polyhydroxyalkanoate synthesis regulator phasin
VQMAKKKNKETPADPMRAAAQALEAAAAQAGFTRERAEQMVDELARAAMRFREAIDDMRPAGSDELRALRDRVAALEERVAALEKPRARRTTSKRTTQAKRAAS